MGIDPISMAIVGTTVAAGGVKAFGSWEGGQATKAAMAYQAQVAENNALIARRNAQWDIQAGDAAASAKGLQTRARVAGQAARQGAAGVSVNTGSAADVRAGTEMLGLSDALTIRSNAAKEAYGQEVAATSDIAQANLDRAEGDQAETAGDIGAAGSLLSGASTAGGQYAQFRQGG